MTSTTTKNEKPYITKKQHFPLSVFFLLSSTLNTYLNVCMVQVPLLSVVSEHLWKLVSEVSAPPFQSHAESTRSRSSFSQPIFLQVSFHHTHTRPLFPRIPLLLWAYVEGQQSETRGMRSLPGSGPTPHSSLTTPLLFWKFEHLFVLQNRKGT